jgi:hypothetical protein
MAGWCTTITSLLHTTATYYLWFAYYLLSGAPPLASPPGLLQRWAPITQRQLLQLYSLALTLRIWHRPHYRCACQLSLCAWVHHACVTTCSSRAHMQQRCWPTEVLPPGASPAGRPACAMTCWTTLKMWPSQQLVGSPYSGGYPASWLCTLGMSC